jgi:hypothetical protein
MDEAIKIGYDKERMMRMSMDEKLNLLIEIAFSNHSDISLHRRLLLGNGDEGICDVVRGQKRGLMALWTMMILIIGGFIGLALR